MSPLNSVRAANHCPNRPHVSPAWVIASRPKCVTWAPPRGVLCGYAHRMVPQEAAFAGRRAAPHDAVLSYSNGHAKAWLLCRGVANQDWDAETTRDKETSAPSTQKEPAATLGEVFGDCE